MRAEVEISLHIIQKIRVVAVSVAGDRIETGSRKNDFPFPKLELQSQPEHPVAASWQNTSSTFSTFNLFTGSKYCQRWVPPDSEDR